MKRCSKCKIEKPLSDFSPRRKAKDGLNGHCKKCVHEKNRKWKRLNPVDYYCSMMLAQAKRRAAQNNREFDLTLEDIRSQFVATCPVLGLPLRWEYGHGQGKDYSPSLDRFDNARGYTKDNVYIISARANSLKSCMTKEEVAAVFRYMNKPPNPNVCATLCEMQRKRKPTVKLTSALIEQIYEMHLSGATCRAIAKATGVSKSNVSNAIKIASISAQG
jgi:hypothetical protein